MKFNFARTFVALCLLTFAFSVLTAAQGIGTYEYYMNYGRESLKTRTYWRAAMHFEDAVRVKPDDAEAYYLLGVAYAGEKETEKARKSFQRAVELDSSYTEKAAEYLPEFGGAEKTSKTVSTPSLKPTRREPAKEDVVEYNVGDAVEVFYGGKWNVGKITEIEGRGKSVFATVEFIFNGSKSIDKFFYNALRQTTRTSEPEKEKRSASSKLVYGTYTCSTGWNENRKPLGLLKLNANGTYNYAITPGGFKYNAATGEITWEGGHIAKAGRSTTRYEDQGEYAVIYITFTYPDGNELQWMCALEK